MSGNVNPEAGVAVLLEVARRHASATDTSTQAAVQNLARAIELLDSERAEEELQHPNVLRLLKELEWVGSDEEIRDSIELLEEVLRVRRDGAF